MLAPTGYNASFIEASIVNRTWTFCALQVQPLIFWDVIQYTTLYYIFFQICILADIPLSFLLDQFQLLLVINSSERSRIVFWNILWNKVLSRRPEISLHFALVTEFIQVWVDVQMEPERSESWSYPAEILHELFHLRPTLMWSHLITLLSDWCPRLTWSVIIITADVFFSN